MPLKKLKEQEKATTQALLAAIEQKDRRFRLFQTLFMVATFIALIFIISAQQRTLAGVENQLKEYRTLASEDSARDEDQQNKIVRRLNCMVYFFTIPNRQGLTIESIDECTLNRDENVDQFFAHPEDTNSERPPNLPDSAPSATSENDVAPVITPEQPDAQPVEETPPVVEPRPPVMIHLPILPDIPVCVPLLDVCVRT